MARAQPLDVAADLRLERDAHGSIARAAKTVGMSCKSAWDAFAGTVQSVRRGDACRTLVQSSYVLVAVND